MSTRVLLICLDAMEPELMFNWSRQGLLPNIAELLSDAGVSRFEFQPWLANVASSASIISGKAPADHGYTEVYGWDAQNYSTFKYDVDRSFPYPVFWESLARQGWRVLMVDWPRAPLRGGSNISQIADWMAHYRLEPARSTPPDLMGRLTTRFQLEAPNGDLDTLVRNNLPMEGVFDWIRHSTDLKTEVMEQMMFDDPYDFVGVNFSAAHDMGHLYWAVHDPTHPDHCAELLERYGDPLLMTYQTLDRTVGRMRDAAGQDTVTMLYTGPGMGPNYSGNGLLDYFLLQLDGGSHTEFSQRRFFELRNHFSAGAVRINLAGRESRGRVSAGEYDATCRELTEHLLALRNLETGAPVVTEVIRTRETCQGKRQDVLPDLYVVWSREARIYGFDSPTAGAMDFGDYAPAWSGDHTNNAVLAVSEPGKAPHHHRTISRFEDFTGLLGEYTGMATGVL